MNNIDDLLSSFAFYLRAAVLPQLLSAQAEPTRSQRGWTHRIRSRLTASCCRPATATSSPARGRWSCRSRDRLGFQSVYRTVAVVPAHCLRPARRRDRPGATVGHSVITAFAAQFVAEDIQAESGMMFTAGLLHDVGKVVLAAAEARGRLGAGHCTEDFHADIGARLLHRWKFSAPLSLSVRFHHQPSGAGQHLKLAACIALANELAHHHDQPQTTDANLNGYEKPLFILELNAPDLDRYRGRLEENVQFVETMCRI